jgi:hypothetical protein
LGSEGWDVEFVGRRGGIDLRCDDGWSIDGVRDEERGGDRGESPHVQGRWGVGGVYLSLLEDRGYRIALEEVLRDLLGRKLGNCILTCRTFWSRCER